MSNIYLEKVYGASDADTLRDVYDQWAASYDADLADADYETPVRIARALKSCLRETDLSGPVLDFGCGTGLSGQALTDAGFARIHGADVSEGMLREAEAKAVYEKLTPVPNGNPDPGLVSRYRLVTAMGAISPGAAPASCLAAIFMALPSGGRVAFSWSDRAQADEEYSQMLDRIMKSSEAAVEFDEDGPHLRSAGSTARVLVIRRR